MAVSLHEATLAAYKATSFDAVPASYVEDAWESNFCESVSLPSSELEDALLDVLAWRGVVENTREWSRAGNQEEQLAAQVSTLLEAGSSIATGPGVGFWTVLFDAGVSHKCLLAIIFALLDRDKPSIRDKMSAALSSQLYFILLQVPGTTAYKTFHPMIFQKALDTLLLYPSAASDYHSGGHAVRRASSKSLSGGRRGKRRRSSSVREEIAAEDEVFCSQQGTGDGADTPRDRELLKQYLKELIKELTHTLQHYSLKHHEVTRCQIITAMIRLTRLELPSSTAHSLMDLSSQQSTSRHCPVHYLSWACLNVLCSPHHGAIDRIIAEVYHHILPVITMVTDEEGVVSTLPLPLTIPSQHAVTFIRHLSSRTSGGCIAGPLRTLVQHVCVRTPDRAEYRSRLAAIVCQLMSLFNHHDYSDMLLWIYKFSRNTKVCYRVFAMDIVSELMDQPLRHVMSDELLPGDSEYRLTYNYLVKMMLSRCSDRSPSVRAKALTCLSAAASNHDNHRLIEAVKKAVFSLTVTDPLLTTPSHHTATDDDSIVMSMLQRRTSDNKVAVRKASLQALESLAMLRRNGVMEQDVSAIHERCLDPALSVRKQAMTSLTNITMENKQCHMIYRFWLDGVLPMVMDPEVGAKDKCLSILEEVILGGVCEGEEFTWTLLNEIVQQDKQDLRRCLRLALQQWSLPGKLSPSLISLLSANTTITSRHQAAWMMLADTAPFTQHIDPGFVLDNWKKWVEQDVAMTTDNVQIVVSVLSVIGNTSRQLSRHALNDIKDRLLVMLSSFELPVAVVTTVMTTLTLLCHTLTSSQAQYQSLLDSWLEDILHCCEQHVSTLMGLSQGLNEDQVILYLFTLGEIAQLCPAHTSPHTGVLIQSLLVATSEAPDIGDGVVLSQEISHFSNLRFTPALRAHAYVTLGKLCLQNEDIAKNSLVLMSRELQYSTQAVIRNNIVVVLCDLAVRYSAKVDPYIPSVAVCLKDPSLLVRKQCLTLLAHLLQDDYIKWKGSLFYQFVSTLVDDHLSKLTEFCLVQLLLARQPNMFYHHFIECIFHFNGYHKHRVFNQFPQSDRERELFSLAGSDNSASRMTIYQFLLSHMTDEHRFQLTTKLCHEILGGVVDGVIVLEDDSTHLIKDTLAILTCKDIKLTTLRRSAQEEAAQEGDAFGVVMATAQTKIITQIVKKNALDNIVPIVIATKHLLEKEHSPLLKDLMMYLSELHKDFPTEIKDILASDPQLAEEIEFDLRRFQEEVSSAAAMAAVPDQLPTVTPHAQLVSPLLTPQALGSVAANANVALTSPQLRQALPRHDPAMASPQLADSSPLAHTNVGGVSSPLVTACRAQDSEDDGVRTPVPQQPQASPLPSVRPLFTRTPRMPLSKIALLTSARKTMRALAGPSTTTPAAVIHPTGATDDHDDAGLGDTLSFNVNSFLSSSPIPVNRSVSSYATTAAAAGPAGSRPVEEGEGAATPVADIVMRLPDSDTNDEATNLPQWDIQ